MIQVKPLSKAQQISRANICALAHFLSLAYIKAENFYDESKTGTAVFVTKLAALKRHAKDFIQTISTYRVGIAETRRTKAMVDFLQQYDKSIRKRHDDLKEVGARVLVLLECANIFALSCKIGCSDFPIIREKANTLCKSFKETIDYYLFPEFQDFVYDEGMSLYYDIIDIGKGRKKG